MCCCYKDRTYWVLLRIISEPNTKTTLTVLISVLESCTDDTEHASRDMEEQSNDREVKHFECIISQVLVLSNPKCVCLLIPSKLACSDL